MLEHIWTATVVVLRVTLGAGLLVMIVGFWWTLVSMIYQYFVG